MTEASSNPITGTGADANSPAFVQAVTQLGQKQAVVTRQAIYNRQGVKLIEGGVQIDARLYDRLMSHRLTEPLDDSIDAAAPVTSAALREACEAAMARQPFFALMGPAGRSRSMLLQAIDAIPLPRSVALYLTLARETRPALYEHSILMAILCAHLVREGGAPIFEMTEAAAAGLLHDLGMLHMDAKFLDPSHRFNEQERRSLYAHPVTASMLVARSNAYEKPVMRAILEHHERLDGSGYPRGLVGDAISPLGRMLSLCDVVTAMFDGDRQHPEQRLSLLLRVSLRQFDPALVPSIHRLLREMPADANDVEGTSAELVERLRVLADLLNQWHVAAAATLAQVDAAGQAVLKAVAAQAETLQRMLFEAGITPEQLGLLIDGAELDAQIRGELWGLTRELQWHLSSTANQLRHRWRAGAQPMPPAVDAWLGAIDALETPA